MEKKNQKIGLFVTCLVNDIHPKIGFDSLALLQRAGYDVVVPMAQVCCGQPAFNNGDTKNARALAVKFINEFMEFDYIVIPSGSCAGMVVKHYGELFEINDPYLAKYQKIMGKTFEITDFLVNIAKIPLSNNNKNLSVTYHDSCSGLRELGIKGQPRALLQDCGYEIKEMQGAEECCGFGGTFCVKFPEISAQICQKKADNINKSGADIVACGDLGCLMNMAGKLHRMGAPVKCFHVVELLNDSLDKQLGDR